MTTEDKPWLSKDELARVVQGFASKNILVVGDIMLDHYLQGEVERISPEAPVPVLQVTREWQALGGAGNVARNVAALGAGVELASVVGADPTGKVVERLLAENSIAGHLIVENRRRTTIKTRVIAGNQQIVRVDREDTRALEGQSAKAFLNVLESLLPRHDVVIVSDYAKGVIDADVMQVIRSSRRPDGGQHKVLIDPKVTHADLYTKAYLLTPNAKEAGEMTGVPTRDREGVLRAGLALYRKMRCDTLCVTLGAKGMAIFEQPDKVVHLPTMAQEVFDVTGAGDTVMAVLALGLASGLGVAQAGVLANLAASVVVGQMGAAVTTPGELLAALEARALPQAQYWLAP